MLLELKGFLRDCSGLSAIEFAFIAPILVTMYLGSVDASDLMIADRKVTNISSTMSDLVAQGLSVTDADVDDIFMAAEAILAPYDVSNMSIRVTSVNIESDGTTSVGWSDAQNTSPLNPGASVTIPAGIGMPGASVIMAEISYDHPSIFGYLFSGKLALDDTFYMRPRRTLRVIRID